MLSWGLLIGLGTGSMALVFAATVASRWFVRRRGLVMGVLTAGSATGQLIFLPVMAWLSEEYGWRAASLLVAAAALAVVPLVLLFLRDRPSDIGIAPYGAEDPTRAGQVPVAAGDDGEIAAATPDSGPDPRAAQRARDPGARPGGPDPDLLGAGRRVRDLRRHHERPRSARTSCRRRTTTAWARPPPPGCSPSSASSTSSARSLPAT